MSSSSYELSTPAVVKYICKQYIYKRKNPFSYVKIDCGVKSAGFRSRFEVSRKTSRINEFWYNETVSGLVGWILLHINLCMLFNAKSIFI